MTKSTAIFFRTSCVALVLLGFFGAFMIKRDFIPLILWGTVALSIAIIERDRLIQLFSKITLFKGVLWLLLGWMVLSTTWGMEPLKQLVTFCRFSASLLLAWAIFVRLPDLSPTQRTFLSWLFFVVVIVTLINGYLKIYVYSTVNLAPKYTHFHRHEALLIALAAPVFYFLCKKNKFLAVLMAAVLLPMFIFGPMKSGAISPAAGLVTYGLIKLNRRLIYFLLAGLILVGAISIPGYFLLFDFYDHLPHLYERAHTSWQHRLLIWDKAMSLYAQQPIIGWGVEATRYFDDMALGKPTLIKMVGYQEIVPPNRFLPIHTHQGFIQVLLELGAIGLGLLCAVWFAGARMVQNKFPKQAPWIGATFFMIVVPFTLNYGLWQSSWISIWLYAILAWRLILLNDKE